MNVIRINVFELKYSSKTSLIPQAYYIELEFLIVKTSQSWKYTL